MIVRVDEREVGHRHGFGRSPVLCRIGTRRVRVSVTYFSEGAGKRYRDGVEWLHEVQLGPTEGALVLVRCAVRWIPFRPVRPPDVTLQVGPNLAIPRSGYWRPGWKDASRSDGPSLK